MVLSISHSLSFFISRIWAIQIQNRNYQIFTMLENIWSESWCPLEKYYFLHLKFSINPSRCSRKQGKPYIGLVYIKNATFSYYWCLWNVLGSSFVSGGHTRSPMWDAHWFQSVWPVPWRVKMQGWVNRLSLKHSMVITLVHSESKLEAIWLLFNGWTALLKWEKWKNHQNWAKSPSIFREIVFSEKRLLTDFFFSIPSI